MWLREISCNFVDRALWIRCHTIHEITLSYTKEHENKSFCAAGSFLLNKKPD